MKVTRRSFFGIAGVTLASLLLDGCTKNVGEKLPAPQEPKKQKLTLDCYIQNIPDDKLSNSFYQDKGKWLFSQVVERVKDFYGRYGVTLEVNAIPRDAVDVTNLGKNHVALAYLTKEQVSADPLRFVKDFKYDKIEQLMESETRKFEQQSGLSYEAAQRQVVAAHIPMIKSALDRISAHSGGFSVQDVHRGVFFPAVRSEEMDAAQFLNRYARVMAHEVGHLLGLGDVTDLEVAQGLYDQRNIMLFTTYPDDSPSFTATLSKSQITTIKENLK